MDADWQNMSLLDRMVNAVEVVRERSRRTTQALDAASIPYAIADGHAVATWVATIDRAAVRNTQDVDILLRREDLDAVEQALKPLGFVRRKVAGIEMFLDGAQAKPRDAVHVVIANEKVRQDYAAAAPDVTEYATPEGYRVLSLEALLRMKLISYRDEDRTHVRDMLDVGLIDFTWIPRLPPELGVRLQHLLDTPDG
jgi:hypothetical protein